MCLACLYSTVITQQKHVYQGFKFWQVGLKMLPRQSTSVSNSECWHSIHIAFVKMGISFYYLSVCTVAICPCVYVWVCVCLAIRNLVQVQQLLMCREKLQEMRSHCESLAIQLEESVQLCREMVWPNMMAYSQHTLTVSHLRARQ